MYTVGYTVRDPCGNTATGTQTVTVPLQETEGCLVPAISGVRSLLGNSVDEDLLEA